MLAARQTGTPEVGFSVILAPMINKMYKEQPDLLD